MFEHHAEKQNYDFHDVDTAQQIARDGQSGVLELERAAQVLDGEVDRLGTELDTARARLASAVAPMQRLRELLTLHSRDWASDRRDALLWALLVGWECEGKCTEADDPEHTCDAALREVAERHQWPPQFVDGVRQHRAALATVSR